MDNLNKELLPIEESRLERAYCKIDAMQRRYDMLKNAHDNIVQDLKDSNYQEECYRADIKALKAENKQLRADSYILGKSNSPMSASTRLRGQNNTIRKILTIQAERITVLEDQLRLLGGNE